MSRWWRRCTPGAKPRRHAVAGNKTWRHVHGRVLLVPALLHLWVGWLWLVHVALDTLLLRLLLLLLLRLLLLLLLLHGLARHVQGSEKTQHLLALHWVWWGHRQHHALVRALGQEGWMVTQPVVLLHVLVGTVWRLRARGIAL